MQKVFKKSELEFVSNLLNCGIGEGFFSDLVNVLQDIFVSEAIYIGSFNLELNKFESIISRHKNEDTSFEINNLIKNDLNILEIQDLKTLELTDLPSAMPFPIDFHNGLLYPIKNSFDEKCGIIVLLNFDESIEIDLINFTLKTISVRLSQELDRQNIDKIMLESSNELDLLTTTLKEIQSLDSFNYAFIEELLSKYLELGSRTFAVQSGFIYKVDSENIHIMTSFSRENTNQLPDIFKKSYPKENAHPILFNQEKTFAPENRVLISGTEKNISANFCIIHPIVLNNDLYAFICFFDKNQKGRQVKDIEEEIISTLSNSISYKIELDMKNKELKNAHKRTEEDLDKIEKIVEATGQGLLVFDQNLAIGNMYSKKCEAIFKETDLTGLQIDDLLFNSKKKQEEFCEAAPLFFSNKIDSDMLNKLLDNELVINDFHINIHYKTLNEKAILCTLTDVTEAKKLEKRLNTQTELQAFLFKILKEKNYLKNLLEQVRQVFSKLDGLAKHLPNEILSHENIQLIIMQIHDLKAGFGFLGFYKAMQSCHDLEAFFIDIQESVDFERFTEIYLELKSDYDEELSVIKAYLGEEWISGVDFVNIHPTHINAIESHIKKKYPEDYTLMEQIMSFYMEKIGSLFSHFDQVVQNTARKLGKEVFQVEIQGEDILINKKYISPLVNVFVHVLRNAVYHGIEAPEERVKKNKDIKGRVQIKVTEHPMNYKFYIWDDGKGIDIEVIKKLARESGLNKNGNIISDKDALQLLFKPEFSTAESIDEISGRGVGLSSVKKEIQKINGKIGIKTELEKGTTFIFYVPKKKN